MATKATLCRLADGAVQWPDSRNRRAINAYYALHSPRTRQYSGAWQGAFELCHLPVTDNREARYYMAAWDRIHQCQEAIIHIRQRQNHHHHHPPSS